jgi:hypothetical protein
MEARKRRAVARSRKNADEALLRGLACGATVESAARAAGISARTAHRRLKEEAFQKSLRDLRAEMVQRTAGMLTASGMEASKTLIDLLNTANPPAVRRSAAQTILELGLKLRENTEMEERLAALEARAAVVDLGS